MKIAFVCPSLQVGKDGVGDYSRRLAGELIRQGHECTALSLHDPYVSEAVSGTQEIEETDVPVMRLPATMPNPNRAQHTQRWLSDFGPHWLSLQFVPFGFQRHGLCFHLPNWLEPAGAPRAWHVMFHELWLGLGHNASVKERIWGGIQRLAVLKVINRLRPSVTHTQNEPYRMVLGTEKINADILPLFSNIPYVPGTGWKGLLEPMVGMAAGQGRTREQLYIAGVLGAVHPQWRADEAVAAILPLVQRSHKRLVLVFLGKNNLGHQWFSDLRTKLRGCADIVVTGERPAVEVSRVLQTLDLGMATTPLAVIQKSGSAAAMLEHGLPLLVTRDDWQLRGRQSRPFDDLDRIFTPQQFAALKQLPVRRNEHPEDAGVSRVARQMISALSSAPKHETAHR